MFRDHLLHYTHWGWIDLDVLMGDMAPLVEALKHFDVVSFPDGVCLCPVLMLRSVFSSFAATGRAGVPVRRAYRVPEHSLLPQLHECDIPHCSR